MNLAAQAILCAMAVLVVFALARIADVLGSIRDELQKGKR